MDYTINIESKNITISTLLLFYFIHRNCYRTWMNINADKKTTAQLNIYEDVRLSRPRRPCYLVSRLNKLNAVESWMRTPRMSVAEGLEIFGKNHGWHDIRFLRYTISIWKTYVLDSAGFTFRSTVCQRARLLAARLNSDLACKVITT